MYSMTILFILFGFAFSHRSLSSLSLSLIVIGCLLIGSLSSLYSLNNATYYSSILEMVPLCDFLILAAPATPETYHLLKHEHFQAMKPSSYFINISRGTLVDQDSLIYALNHGTIQGAGLDVTDPEPLPRDHPLLQCKNCIITPHTGSATYQTRQAMLELALQNMDCGLNDQPLIASPNQQEIQLVPKKELN